MGCSVCIFVCVRVCVCVCGSLALWGGSFLMVDCVWHSNISVFIFLFSSDLITVFFLFFEIGHPIFSFEIGQGFMRLQIV